MTDWFPEYNVRSVCTTDPSHLRQLPFCDEKRKHFKLSYSSDDLQDLDHAVGELNEVIVRVLRNNLDRALSEGNSPKDAATHIAPGNLSDEKMVIWAMEFSRWFPPQFGS
jgi:hypothetical protein